jgi:hypothetical protein
MLRRPMYVSIGNNSVLFSRQNLICIANCVYFETCIDDRLMYLIPPCIKFTRETMRILIIIELDIYLKEKRLLKTCWSWETKLIFSECLVHFSLQLLLILNRENTYRENSWCFWYLQALNSRVKKGE